MGRISRILRESLYAVLLEANETYEQKAALLRRTNGEELDKSKFLSILAMDPTSDGVRCGKYFDWLYRNYSVIGNSYMKSQIRDSLQTFSQGKAVLQKIGESSNIQDYDVQSLVYVVSKIDNARSPMSVAVNKFNGEYEVLYQDSEWVVVHPKTWKAERYFGSGTKWCTVGNENYFNQYNSGGKLFVVIPVENGVPNIGSDRKWQCSVSAGMFCCASRDDVVFYSFREFFQHHPEIKMSRGIIDALERVSWRFNASEENARDWVSQKRSLLADELGIDSSEVHPYYNGNDYWFAVDDVGSFMIMDSVDEAKAYLRDEIRNEYPDIDEDVLYYYINPGSDSRLLDDFNNFVYNTKDSIDESSYTDIMQGINVCRHYDTILEAVDSDEMGESFRYTFTHWLGSFIQNNADEYFDEQKWINEEVDCRFDDMGIWALACDMNTGYELADGTFAILASEDSDYEGTEEFNPV